MRFVVERCCYCQYGFVTGTNVRAITQIGAVLYSDFLQHNPKDPQWLNRDRFVLSGGHGWPFSDLFLYSSHTHTEISSLRLIICTATHLCSAPLQSPKCHQIPVAGSFSDFTFLAGSMFLYSWLHMSGYDIPMSEVKNFRQHHSATPGHPEFPNSEHNTPGIEATTGPLGQGVVNAAGIAAAQKMEQAMFNTKDHEIFNSVSVALCGDGCLQEGVSAEGAQFAVSRLLLVPSAAS